MINSTPNEPTDSSNPLAAIEQTNPVFHDVSGETSHDVGVSSEQITTGEEVTTKTSMATFDDSNIAFLKRDTLIASKKWTTSEINWQFDPWQTLAGNAAVAQRLNYMTYLETGGLRLTIRVNGSPYYPGRIGVCWTPMNQNDYTFGGTTPDMVHLSTRPLFMMIDTTKDATYEMIIPQIRPTKMTVGSSQVWGRVIFFPVAQLRSISSSSTLPPSVDISVFAAMVDPRAYIKTSIKSFYATSGEARGYISAPLAKIASYASVMSKTPVIGDYATGIGMAASLGSSLASKFGFSKQPDLSPQLRIYPELVPNMANTLGVDGAPMLTFDPAVATSLDKGIAGGSQEDEMAISRFVRSWSLCAPGNTWVTNQDIGANLLSIKCNPYYGSTQEGTFNPTARTSLCFAADLHKYWSGSLEFRFTIPVTKFHTGRCQFYFDQTPSPSTLDITNLCYNVIMDLSVSNTVTMVVPYASLQPWCTRDSTMWGKAAPSSRVSGYLHCKVLNAMRAGGGHADVAPIIVEIRGGEDFMLAGPTMEYCRDATRGTSYFPESVDTPYTVKPYAYYGTSDQAYAVAEPVVSFRQHIKRYSATWCGTIPTTTQNFNYRGIRDYPIPSGFIQTSTGVVRKHGVPWSPITVLMGCYVGMRGGTRHLLLPNQNYVRQVLINAVDFVSDTMNGVGESVAINKNMIMFNQNIGMSGGQVFMPTQTNRVMRYGSMQRSRLLFEYTYAIADADTLGPGVIFTGVGDSPTELSHFVSAADDFDFIQFKGIPYVYYYGDPLVAALPAEPLELPEFREEALAPNVFDLRDLKESLLNPEPLPLARSESGMYGPHYEIDEEAQ